MTGTYNSGENKHRRRMAALARMRDPVYKAPATFHLVGTDVEKRRERIVADAEAAHAKQVARVEKERAALTASITRGPRHR